MGFIGSIGYRDLSCHPLAQQDPIAQRSQTPRHQWHTCHHGPLAVLPSACPDKANLRLVLHRMSGMVI